MALVKNLALIGLVTIVGGLIPARAQERPASWRDGYVMANGIRIHYLRTGGDKPALVLAHGFGGDAAGWTNFARAFEQGFDIIMYDARGHGLSDPPIPTDPPDVNVHDLAAIIRELRLDNPVLMGHSMGTFTVADFAARYPGVPRAVILEDPALGQPTTGRTSVAAETTAGPQVSLEERRAAILARNNLTEEALVTECLADSPTWGRSECELWAPAVLRQHPFTLRTTPIARPRMDDLFPRITAPTLILKADADGELRRHNDSVARHLKNGRIVHIKGAGHNVRREGRQEVLEVLRRFLENL